MLQAGDDGERASRSAAPENSSPIPDGVVEPEDINNVENTAPSSIAAPGSDSAPKCDKHAPAAAAAAVCDSGDQSSSSGKKTATRGLPPGPGGPPLLGSLLRWEGPETNWAWTQQFGPIYSVRMGPSQLVYLNTIELVEEYMERKGSTLLGRPEGPAAIANGLLFGQGERWVENRRAFVRALWQESFTPRYEHIVQQEVDYVVEQLSVNSGKVIEVRQILLPAVTRRLVTLLLGQPLDRDDEDIVTLVNQMTLVANDVDLTSTAMRLFLKVKRFRRLIQCLSGLTIPDMFKISEVEQNLIKGWISRRRTALTQSGGQADPNSLLDQLLTSPEYVSRGQEFDQELLQSIMDLFNGGISPIISVLDFAILYLIHHPDVQDKLRAEITQNLTNGHPISWNNRDRFPYTHATLIETLRLASVTPSSLPHVASEDVVIEDFGIPTGVIVVANIFSLHRDPRFYGQKVEEFRPERHLAEEEDGRRVVVQPRSFRPFGVGERLCLGHNMAQVELFVFLARLVAAFRFRAVDPSHPPPLLTKMRVVRRLKPFTCIAERLD
ncbi:hypothetical protein ACOMHN_008460 [Nucella lapillus]